NRWALTEADYWTMCIQKTASYTCVAPCRFGAIIAGATKEKLDRLTDMCIHLGVAFQIQDDVLNLIGEESKYGKEIGGDISEGKRTLVLIHLLNACTPEHASRVIEIMSKPREDKHPDEIQEVLGLMDKYGCIQYAQQRSRELAQKAYTKFNQDFSDLPASRAKDIFLHLIHFVIEREY
ncbi:MAG: polyprenyl synthetase family protein, partial [Candidatus Poribacteria bacterium]|nr:polyprenyl synthetase family protein [Candidatus Poribacteria bacterium]